MRSLRVFNPRGSASRPLSRAVTWATTAASASPLLFSLRSYIHWVPEDLVPEGENAQGFQSSNLPSERVRIIRELALSPDFGSREPLAILASSSPPRVLMQHKAALRRLVEDVLELVPGTVTMGTIESHDRSRAPMIGGGSEMLFGANGAATNCRVALFLPDDIDTKDRLEATKVVNAAVNDRSSGNPFRKFGVVSSVEATLIPKPHFNIMCGKPVSAVDAMHAHDTWESKAAKVEESDAIEKEIQETVAMIERTAQETRPPGEGTSFSLEAATELLGVLRYLNAALHGGDLDAVVDHPNGAQMLQAVEKLLEHPHVGVKDEAQRFVSGFGDV